MSIGLLGTLRGLSYLAASMLFILSLRGLSTQESARGGNVLGTVGMGLAVLITALALVVTSMGLDDSGVDAPETGRRAVTLLFAALIGGAAIGSLVASRVAMTSMPELVAMLHSFVGAAAVLVGIARPRVRSAATKPTEPLTWSRSTWVCRRRRDLQRFGHRVHQASGTRR